MLTKREIYEKKQKMYDEEVATGIKKYIWMSFVDPEKEKGKRFLGVIIIKAFGKTDAMWKSHDLIINPGGAIMFSECPIDKYTPKEQKELDGILNKLLNRNDLKDLGL